MYLPWRGETKNNEPAIFFYLHLFKGTHVTYETDFIKWNNVNEHVIVQLSPWNDIQDWVCIIILSLSATYIYMKNNKIKGISFSDSLYFQSVWASLKSVKTGVTSLMSGFCIQKNQYKLVKHSIFGQILCKVLRSCQMLNMIHILSLYITFIMF